MPKSLLNTEEPAEALLFRGYTFKPATYGFSFGPRGKANAYKVGVLGSVFMNDLLERSSLEGVATFRFMFGIKRYAAGDISSCFPPIAEDMLEKGRTLAEADRKAVDLFLSDELSGFGMKMPCLYEIPLVNAKDVLVETDGGDGRTILRVKGDDKPFYYLVSMPSSDNPRGEIPAEWKTMLATWQYSYHFDAVGMRMAISNTKSAYFGLPPNSTAVRMPLLRTDIIPELCSLAVGKKAGSKSKGKGKQADKAGKAPKEKKTKSSEPKRAVSKRDPAAWQPKLKQFLDDPTELNHKALLDDRSAWRFFSSTNDTSDALGKSRYAIKRLRRPFVGAANAADGRDLVRMIREHWADEAQHLVAIFKWSTLTRWEQGKFYFHQEEKAKGLTVGPPEGPAEAEA